VHRAVGHTRHQTRAMVRGEAVLVALFGTVGGLGMGLLLSCALASALTVDGPTPSIAIPTVQLARMLARVANVPEPSGTFRPPRLQTPRVPIWLQPAPGAPGGHQRARMPTPIRTPNRGQAR
jgi:ABC-type antimicrobial peptide transport system permease subunit